MRRYMLDTDIASYAIKRSNLNVVKRIEGLNSSDLCVSVVTKGEMMFGVEISPRKITELAAVQDFLRYVAALELPSEAANEYGLIRAELKRQGTPIGSNDMWIAAHAMHLGLTLATNNVREFSQVPGLLFENWAETP